MAIEEVWGVFFKSEIKSSGFKLFSQEKISLSGTSDTLVEAYVRVAPPFKVRLVSEGISSRSFTAECTCPMSKKSQFCKHVWAALLCVEQKYPDFLSVKNTIEKPGVFLNGSLNGSLNGAVNDSAGESANGVMDSRAQYQASAKLRASEYRKEQYQKQKLRVKALKKGVQKRDALVDRRGYSTEIEGALAYFSDNGFPMGEGPSEEVLSEAKRKLSRVFHPDRGGSNDEIVELNRNCELILRFLRD